MKKFRSAILTVLSVLFVLIITTCKRTVALGSTVDVLPPSSSVTRDSSASDSVAKAGSFTIEGVASDDSGVASVTVVFENRETKERLPAMSATLAQPGAPKTAWKLVIDNEWKGEYVDERELVKKYPIRDSEYNVIITITDRNNKSSQQTLVYTIDNTPPVVIIDRPALIAESANWTNARSSTYGSILRISGQAQDTSRVQEIEFKAYDSENPTADSYSITKNLGGAVSISQEIAAYDVDDTTGFPKAGSDYTKLLNLQGCNTQQKITGTSEIFTRNILADYYVKDSVIKNGQTTGNVNEFYYARDTISELFNGEANGYKKNYDAKTIYNYLSNRQPWDDKVPESQLLKAFREDTEAQKLLKNARIMCGTDAATATKKSVLTLDPNKDPGYFVSSLKVINNDTVSDIVSMNMGVPLTINLMKNMNEVPIVVSPLTVEKLEATKLRVFLVSEPTGGIEKLIENMQKLSVTYDGTASGNKIGDPSSESEVIKIYDINEHTGAGDTTFIETNGNYVVKVKLPNGAAGKYGLVLVGQDSKSNEFFPRDENGNRVSGGSKQIILNLIASGAPPTIIANDLNKYYKKDTSFEYTFTVERPDKVTYSIKKSDGSEIVSATPITPSPGTADYKIKLDLSADPWNSASDGQYSITINAKNSAGNCNPKNVLFYLDNTKPTLSIKSPTTTDFGQWINEFTVLASDNLMLDSVYYQVEDGAKMPFGESTSVGEYKATISLTKETSKVKFYAYDKAGNQSEITEKTYIVNTKSPLITVKLPDASTGALHPVSESSTYVAKSALNNFEVKVKASPQLSGVSISKISIALSGYDGTITAPSSEKANPVNGEYTATFSLKEENFNKGSIKVTVRAYDDSTPANAGIVDKFIQIDNTAPDFTVSTSTTYFTGPTAEFKGKVIENESGLDEASLQFKLFKKSDNGAWDDKTPASPNNKIKVTGADWTISLDGLSEQGKYKWTATVKDKAGNAATQKEVAFAIDTELPTLTVASYADGTNAIALTNGDTSAQIYKNGDFWLAGTVEDSNALDDTDAVVISGLGTVPIKIAKNAIGTDKKWKYNVTGLTSGTTYTAAITATDVAKKTFIKQLIIIYDTAKPGVGDVTITKNSATIDTNKYIGVGPIDVAGTVTETGGSGVAKVEYSVDGGTLWKGFSGGESFNGTITVSAGTSSITIRATDKAGNVSEPKTISLKVDSTPPTLTASADKTSVNATSGSTITITANGEDKDSHGNAGSGIARYEYKKEGEASFASSTAGTFTVEPTADTVYVVRAVDNVGLIADEVRIPISYDTDPPTVNFAAGLDGKTVNKTVKISGTTTELKGLEKLELQIGGSLVTTFNGTAGYSWSYDLDTTAYTDNTDLVLEAIATDSAGNTNTKTITLKVNQNSDRPVIVISNMSSLDGFYLTTGRELIGSVSDDDGEIKKFEVSEDGVNYEESTSYSGGTWKYTFKGTDDGAKKLYFRITDNADTPFISSNEAVSGNALLVVPKIFAGSKPSTEPATVQGKYISLNIDNNPPQFGEPAVQFTEDSSLESGLTTLDGSSKFSKQKIYLQVKAKDDNGIKSVTVKNLGSDISLTKKSGTNGSDELWRSGEIDLSSVPEGVIDVVVTIKDNAGSKAKVNRTVVIDRTAPEIELIYPTANDKVGGTVNISGTIEDKGDGASGVKATGTKYKFVKRSDPTPNADDNDWLDMNASTAANWSLTYNFDAITDAPAEYGTQNTTTPEYYDIPIYIRVEDEAGNVAVIKKIITVNPNGKKPIVTVLSPTTKADGTAPRLGGTIRIFGSTSVLIGTPADIGEVDIMFSKSGNFKDDGADCTFGTTDWYNSGNGRMVPGTDTNGGAQWSCTINDDKSFNPASGQTQDVWFKVRAKNNTITSGTSFGAWSVPIKIVIDTDAPTIGSPNPLKIDAKTVTAPTADAADYLTNMWIGADKKLFGSLYDKSGIKAIEITGDLNNGQPMDKDDLVTNGWITKDTVNTSETAEPNYNLALPLDLSQLRDEAKRKGEFGVKITIIENTTNELRSEQTLTFKFDTTPPVGDFGQPLLVSSGSFSGNGIINQTLADRITEEPNRYKVFVDNKIHSVTDRDKSSSKVSFDGEPVSGTKLFILYKPEMFIFDGTGPWQVMGIANDDGSGVKKVEAWVEVGSKSTEHVLITEADPTNRITKELGSFVSWKGSITTNGKVPDGKGKLYYKISDQSGNPYSNTVDVDVRNQPVKVNKVILGTKVGGVDLITSNGNGNSDITYTSESLDAALNQTKACTSVNFAFKSTTDSSITLELSGGSGTKKYKLLYGTEVLHDLSAFPSDGKIALTAGDLTKIGNSTNGTAKTLRVQIWDTREGYTQGEGTPAATVDITTLFDALDSQKPVSVILPFHWNGEKQNSLFENSRKNGHIEINGDATAQVSGKITLRGFAYDNINVKKLTATVDGQSVSLDLPATQPATENGLTLKVTKSDADYMGHYVEWQLDWDTEKYTAGTGKIITVIANDGAAGDSDEKSDRPVLKTVTQDGFTAKYYDPADFPTETKPNQFVLLKKGEMQYLGRVKSVAASTHSLSIVDSSSLAGLTFDKAKVFGYEENANKITVDVVPYITKIGTFISDSTGYEFARSAHGDYSVRLGETIKLYGFNLPQSKSDIVAKVGTVSLTVGEKATDGDGDAYYPITVAGANLKSNNLDISVKVGTEKIMAINNSNKNPEFDADDTVTKYGYNSMANVANKRLTDDVKLAIWDITNFHNTIAVDITSPMLKIDSASNWYMSYGKGIPSLVVNKNGTETQIDYSFNKFHNTAVAYDDDRNIYALATNTDRISNDSAKFSFYSRAVYCPNGSSKYQYSWTGKTLLEKVYNEGVYDINRVKRPKMVVTGNTSSAKVYIAYFDSNNSKNPVKFRYGTVNSLNNVTDSIANESYASYKTVADNGKAYKGGEYVAVGVTSEGIVVLAWYDASKKQLVYSWNNDPSKEENWQKNAKVIDSYGGWYVDIAVDEDNGIHIAYNNTAKGDLKYAYMSSYNAEAKVVTVDSYFSVGTQIMLSTRKEGGNNVPYISYYQPSFTLTPGSVRVAWRTDFTTLKDGAKNDSFTGTWEAMTIPNIDIPKDETICNGVPKSGVWANTQVLGFMTYTGYKKAVLQK